MAVKDSNLVLVTEPEYRKGAGIFDAAGDVACEAAPPEEAALAELVARRGVRAVIVGVSPYQGPLYEALGQHGGGIIARFGVGHDGLDKTLAQRRRIVITNTPNALDESVAEHTLFLLGALARSIAPLDAAFRAGTFADPTGAELCGKTLGILGFGAIGRRVAQIAHFGFGMRVLGCGRRPVVDNLKPCGVESYTDNAEALLRQCDILSVHLRSDASTRHFLNAQRLGWLKPGALLINTARGALLDEVALFDALVAGRLAGAALDVFEQEPYKPAQPDKDLRRLKNVLLTPHIGSNTCEANRRMAKLALENVTHFLAGNLACLSRVDSPRPSWMLAHTKQ